MEETTDAITAALLLVPRGFNARYTQVMARDAIRAIGLQVQLEYRVPNRGDGRSGRIDLVAWKPSVLGPRYAIEIDAKTPRKRSLFKLREFRGIRIIVLRDGKPGIWSKPPDKIHVALGLLYLPSPSA